MYFIYLLVLKDDTASMTRGARCVYLSEALCFGRALELFNCDPHFSRLNPTSLFQEQVHNHLKVLEHVFLTITQLARLFLAVKTPINNETPNLRTNRNSSRATKNAPSIWLGIDKGAGPSLNRHSNDYYDPYRRQRDLNPSKHKSKTVQFEETKGNHLENTWTKDREHKSDQ
jgi:hypothetical protein